MKRLKNLRSVISGAVWSVPLLGWKKGREGKESLDN
jgi:hypothetical protein